MCVGVALVMAFGVSLGRPAWGQCPTGDSGRAGPALGARQGPAGSWLLCSLLISARDVVCAFTGVTRRAGEGVGGAAALLSRLLRASLLACVRLLTAPCLLLASPFALAHQASASFAASRAGNDPAGLADGVKQARAPRSCGVCAGGSLDSPTRVAALLSSGLFSY